VKVYFLFEISVTVSHKKRVKFQAQRSYKLGSNKKKRVHVQDNFKETFRFPACVFQKYKFFSFPL